MSILKVIKIKVIISIVLVIVFFGFLASFLIFFQSRGDFVELKRQDLELATHLQAHQINQVFVQSKGLAKSLAKTGRIIDSLLDYSSEEHDDLLAMMEGFNVDDYYSSIYIMDKEGNTIVSTDRTFEGKNYSFRRYFKEAMSNKSFVDMAIGVTSKKAGYYFSHVVEKNGEAIGVVVFKLKPEILDKIVYSDDASTEELIMLVNEYGIIVSTNKKNALYKTIGTISEEDLKIIEEGRNFSGLDFEAPHFYLTEYENIKIIVDGLREVEAEDSYRYLRDGEKLFFISKASDYFSVFIIREVKIGVLEVLDFKNALWLSIIVGGAALAALIILIIVILLIIKDVPEYKQQDS